MAKYIVRKRKPPVVREAIRSVGVRELRQNLSVYLELVKTGAALTVTDHGREVAILRPMPKGDSPLQRMVAEGRATPPMRALRNLPPALKLDLEKPLSQIITEMRDEEEY